MNSLRHSWVHIIKKSPAEIERFPSYHIKDVAKLLMTSDEPDKLVALIETLFPGVKLDPIHAMLRGTALVGNLTITKKLADGKDVVLGLEIK